ncbi:MAG: hypothetical protein IJS50_03980, partial [Desulfovibrio sp.]|nr:hypothetical protein [Desulfovibrio sp.]
MIQDRKKYKFFIKLPVFCLVLLVPMLVLLTAWAFVAIHESRDLLTDNARVHGEYQASLEMVGRLRELESTFWHLATDSWERENSRLFQECRQELQALAILSAEAKPTVTRLQKALLALEARRQALLSAKDPESLAKQQELFNNTRDLVQSIPELLRHLAMLGEAEEHMGKQLKENVLKAKHLENLVLLFLVASLGYLALGFYYVQ